MRNMLAFLGAAIVVFLGLGWYLGWYNVLLQPGTPGHSRLEVDINKEKIGQDVKKGSEKVQDLIDKNKQTPNSGTEEKPSSSLLAPPPGTQSSSTISQTGLQPTTNTLPKPSERAEEKFKDFIIDGWLSSPPKK